MIYSVVPSDYLTIRVQNKSTLAWTDIISAGNELQIERGGSVGVLGLSSVDTGTLQFTLYNALDPAVTATLSPKMLIQAYSPLAANPDAGSVFLGKIVDINSTYVLNTQTNQVDTYVYILATDAVYDHSNVTIDGVTTTAGYQRWEERIATLEPYALTTINTPAINQNTIIDNF